MDIQGLGDKLVEQLVDQGLGEDACGSVFSADSAAGDARAHGREIRAEIACGHRSRRSAPHWRVFCTRSAFATSARRRRWPWRSTSPNIAALRRAGEEQIQRVPDVGPVVAKQVADYFRDAENAAVVDRLLAAGISWPATSPASASSALRDKIFVLTGYA